MLNEKWKIIEAIFIDAKNQKVEKIRIGNDWQSIRDKIGARVIGHIELAEGVDLIHDDEFLLNDCKNGFTLDGGLRIGGNALIVGYNDEGEWIDCNVPAFVVEMCLTFDDLTENPLPEPEVNVIGFDNFDDMLAAMWQK